MSNPGRGSASRSPFSKIAAIALVALMSPVLAAQAATFTTYGNGCHASGIMPTLAGTPPVIGSNCTIALSNARGRSRVILAVGVTRSNVSLPGGCGLLVNPIHLVFSIRTRSDGSARLTFPVPNDTNLIGSRFTTQFAVDDPGASAIGLALSNAGEGTLGTAIHN